ncbi:DUF4411 family protein [Caenispirillum salinarum]|uniref:DUF4411 family protein n=1 Tax=Caenispirillum salinarum TaxID=859058 RepID=UPI0009FD3951|nr:DUF4411 family protein [Caenispirillum salinarum]
MFLLDANVFIEAKNRYYAFDICPGFWAWMDHVVTGGDVCSIDRVRDELIGGNDDLATWVKARRGGQWFLDVSDDKTQQAFRQVVASVNASSYKPHAKRHFLSGADPWLVAKASITGASVVTHEVFNAESKRKVPLPNVCRDFGVPFCDTYALLREKACSFYFAAA